MKKINTVIKIEKISFIVAFYIMYGDEEHIPITFSTNIMDNLINYIIDYSKRYKEFNALYHVLSYPIYLN